MDALAINDKRLLKILYLMNTYFTWSWADNEDNYCWMKTVVFGKLKLEM